MIEMNCSLIEFSLLGPGLQNDHIAKMKEIERLMEAFHSQVSHSFVII
jgi:hypothetical protein